MMLRPCSMSYAKIFLAEVKAEQFVVSVVVLRLWRASDAVPFPSTQAMAARG